MRDLIETIDPWLGYSELLQELHHMEDDVGTDAYDLAWCNTPPPLGAHHIHSLDITRPSPVPDVVHGAGGSCPKETA